MPPSKKKPLKKPLCLCGCKEPVHSRGLSLACYHATRRLVARGVVTWEQLIGEGLALPAIPMSERRHRNPHAEKIRQLAAAADSS